MSLFGMKDVGGGEDQILNLNYSSLNQQQPSQDPFGYDSSHQNGFGFGGYGAHNTNSLSQQPQQLQQRTQLNMPGVVQQPQSQQQQLYRGGPLPGQDSSQFLGGARPPNAPFNNQVNPVPIGGQSLSGNLSAMSTPSRNEYLLQSRQPNTLSDPGSFPALSRLGNQLGGQLRNDEDMSINPNDDFPALPGAQSKSDQAVGGALGILGSGGSVFGKDLNIASASENPSNAAVGFAGPSSAFFPPGGNAGLAPLGTGASLLERGNKPGGLGLLGSNALQDGGSSGSLGSSLLGGQTSQSSGLLANLGLAQSSTSSSTTALSKESKYGLGGLLDIIRSNDREGNALVLGTDLTTFGLNLNASESLYPNFISPFSDNTQTDEPNYKTPDCYMMHPPALKSEHLAKFQTETLFYMFYQLPRDILQACAAQELYRREWRYHGELKIWLKPRTQQEIVQAHSNIQFIYFDIKSWESRLFNAQIRGNLIAGLIPEEEIRVKAPLPGQASLSEPS